MGLDISYYTNLRLVEPQPATTEAGYKKDYLYVTVDKSFQDQADGLAHGMFYHAMYIDGFRAGSYSGYGYWRDRLAQVALGMTANEVWNLDRDVKAFGELINFSDCEGTIGSKTSAKLAKDFTEYAGRIKERLNLSEEMDAYFWEQYQNWMQAFKTAAKNGCVTLG